MLRNFDKSFRVWMHWKRRSSCFGDREPLRSKQQWMLSRGKVWVACGVGSLEARHQQFSSVIHIFYL
ncbi:hypothetical protein ZEAMMB73_Zm00001d016532 [Zea mays]|uniref:Uncharacterized protein n=1 Tax=Zea mays TaxID=4577 RepID=A0A1D6H8R2_MAIZE|nr:hypothetical protein ZEAMMB73_Zm00001d016532 [Zea mays]